MTVFHWVRHGPTHQKTLVGWRDVPADLSDTAQIARLRVHLPAAALVVSSDLRRASATADAIATGQTRLPDDPQLREFDFGDWDGKPFSEVAETHPALSRAYWETPGDVAPPNGESWNAAAHRVNAAVDALCAAHPDRQIIAVAHIGVILTQVQRALGRPARDMLAQKIDNLSVTRLTLTSARWQLGCVNHLP